MYTITYQSYDGRYYDFSKEAWNVAVADSGIDGLVGNLAQTTITSTAWGGQTVTSQRPEPITGGLTLRLHTDSDTEIGELYTRVRESFHPTKPGLLIITSSRGSKTLDVRLDGAAPPPEVDTTGRGYIMAVKIPLVSDSGVWLQDPQTGTGRVNVFNPGEVPMHVSVSWTGRGRKVTLPSGWQVELPAVGSTEHTASLDPRTGFTVRDAAGAVAREHTRALVATALPEPVPPGESKEFNALTGVTLTWQVPSLDPWI